VRPLVLALRFFLAAALALPFALVSSAATLRGMVRNGTTGKPAAGVKLILLALQGGMQPVGDAVSDAEGRFSFENPNLGAQPMLVRAVYKEINFHQAVPPGKLDIEIPIFEPTKDPKVLHVSSRVVVLQPNGEKLVIGEEYAVENNAEPPQAFYRADGSFEITLPANATLQQVAAAGPAGMPVVQAPIEKPNGKVAIAFAFRPGQSTIRYSYEIPYPGNSASVTLPMNYAVGRLIVVAAPTVQISGGGLQPGGQEQGMNIYGRENVAAAVPIVLQVSGTAPAESSSGQAGDGTPAGAQIQVVPGRLDSIKWILILAFVAVFGMGAILLSRKQIVVHAPGNGVAGGRAAPIGNPGSDLHTANGEHSRAASEPEPPMKAEAMSEVDAHVGSSLDALKDRLFRLELRRQAGTIAEAEYAQERAKAEQILRDLVKG
jgi:hypothetical protein